MKDDAKQNIIRNLINDDQILDRTISQIKSEVNRKLKKIQSKSQSNFLEFSLDDYKISKEQQKKMSNQKDYFVCSQIKKEGKQKQYCEEKYQTFQDEKIIIDCFNDFCNNCCEQFDKECLRLCESSHLEIINTKDPERIFMEICQSEQMIGHINQFCQRFYSKNEIQLKICLTSFCEDCCISELKISDQNDKKVKECSAQCFQRTNKQVDKLNRTPSLNNNNQIQQINDSKRIQKNSKGDFEQCSMISSNDQKRQQFCEHHVDANSKDSRVHNESQCQKYICPLCCEELFEDDQIFQCQQSCHQKKINQQQGNQLKSSESQQKDLQLNEDELDFLATLCASFRTSDCQKDLCQKVCQENFKELSQPCSNHCIKNIKNIELNKDAQILIEYLIEKKNQKQMNFFNQAKKDRFMSFRSNSSKSLDDQISDVKNQVNKLQNSIIKLENYQVQLERLKTLELKKAYMRKESKEEKSELSL